MKTTEFKLFATMITLAAVITITSTPVLAQRRSTGRQSSNTRVLKSEKSRAETVRKRSTFRDNSRVERTPKPTSIKKTRYSRNSKTTTSPHSSRGSRTSSVSKRILATVGTTNRSTRLNAGRTATTHRKSISRNSSFRSSGNSVPNRRQHSVSTHSSSSNRRGESSRNVSVNQPQSRTTHAVILSNSGRRETSSYSSRREKYHLAKNDKRYSPTRNYHGSNKTWSGNDRPASMNYNFNTYNYYTNYNYYNHNHWNHSWENYRWNYNSWRDYYYGYNPYSYRYNSYYYYDNYYGDVLRRFTYTPYVFVHNFRRYYCYNGHFFRYHRGVGYVLIDIPFGFSFEYLPANYERVYINGYLYFRVGNLFFEHSNLGFQLVHYPERYYAFDDNYQDDDCYCDEW